VSMAGRGGLPEPRPDQQRNFPPAGVQPGSFSGIIRARVIIVSGAGGGVFVYNGTPALGNPPVLAIVAPGVTTDPFGNAVNAVLNIGSLSGAHFGVDQFGNVYMANAAGTTTIYMSPTSNVIEFFPTGTGAGPAISIGSIAGTDQFGHTFPAGIALAGLPFLIYSGTPAAGNLIGSWSPVSTTDTFGNPVPQGLNVAQGTLNVGSIPAATETLNPGPLLEYGSTGTAVQLFTANGTFTPPASFVAGSAQVLAIGPGASGAAAGAGIAGPGGGAGASAYNAAAPFTALTGYAVTVPAAGAGSATTIATDSTTLSAPAGHATAGGGAGGLGGAAGTGPAGTTGFAGGTGGSFGSVSGGGGGGAGGTAAGGTGGNPAGGLGAPPFSVFPGGGTGGAGNSAGNGHNGSGYGAGGGGAPAGSSGGAGTAGMVYVVYSVTGGVSGLVNSVATATGTDPNTGTNYQAGITNYNLSFGNLISMSSGILFIATVSTTLNIQNSSGFPVAIATTADGNTYDMTRLTAIASGQTFNSVTFTDVTGTRVNVGPGTYKVTGQVDLVPLAAAGAAEFQFTGTATVPSMRVTFRGVNFGTPGSLSATVDVTALSSVATGGLFAAVRQLWDISGTVVVSAAGTFGLQGACTIAAQTWTIAGNGTWLQIEPVVA
jgi:hypothetical protein